MLTYILTNVFMENDSFTFTFTFKYFALDESDTMLSLIVFVVLSKRKSSVGLLIKFFDILR